MVHRFLTLAVVLTLAGAPAVVEACQALCADSGEHHSATSHESADHTCHDVPASPSIVTRADVHTCAHGNDLPSTVQETSPGAAAPGVVPTIVAEPSQQGGCSGPAAVASPSPPERAARTTQMRL